MKPVDRRSLPEQVADQLRDLILLEKLAPGAQIVERETAAALGVSRTPLRESLRMLASEGLVEIQANRVPRVAKPSLDDLQELLTVQATLEGLAGELACVAASDQQLVDILLHEKQMREISETADPLAFFELDMKFHQSIVAAAGNSALQDTHRMYNARLWRARFISSRRRVNRKGTLKQHREIAKALKKRDADAAALALKTHLHTGYHNICKALIENESSAD